jgi:hypothetical protein
VTGFCESCGRYHDPAFPAGGTLRQSADGRYLCPRCFAIEGQAASESGRVARGLSRSVRRAAAWISGRRGLVVAAGAIGVIAVVVGWQWMQPQVTPLDGGVLGAIQNGPSATTSQAGGTAATAAASATAQASQPPTPGAASASPSSEVGTVESAFLLDEPAALTWRGSLGETRMEVIVPVRNVGSGWIQLPRSASTYQVVDGQGREIASGVFTAALPTSIGPSQVGYLIDTVSVAFVAPRGTPSVKAQVEAVPVDRPSAELTVTNLVTSTGASGGLRVTGVVRNQGARTADWVIAGAILLGDGGRPLAAVYDPSDVGRLDPGAALAFDTEYPGAPPPPDDAGTTLVGIAFEALDDPTQ